MKRLLITALALLLTSPIVAQAQPTGQAGRQRTIRVRVVDIAGGRIYVEPGEEAGIRRGDHLVFRRRRFDVVGLTRSYAVVDAESTRLSVGDRGRVRVTGEADETHEREPVPPVEELRGQWPEPRPPALDQHPELVELGFVAERGPVAVVLSTWGGLTSPISGQRGDALGQGFLRARIHAEPFEAVPLSLDGDAALQLWVAGDRRASASRPIVRVRELQIAYGEDGGLFGALGRMRYAASTLGQLDGLRVRSPALSGLTVGAFGGFVPDPLTGAPSLDASRFGVELVFSDLKAEWRPTIEVVAHGSRFDGTIDERRATAAFHLFPGSARLGGHAELSLFDADNPWNASDVDLTAAGLDAQIRSGALRVGGRLDLRKPERSRWLAAFLPPGFLCVSEVGAPASPPTPEPCADRFDARMVAAGDVGVDLPAVSFDAGATVRRTGDRSDLDQLGGFVQARAPRLLRYGRADASVMVSSGRLVRTLSGRVGAGLTLLQDSLDFGAHYRPSLTRYEADTGSFIQHTVGASVRVTPISDLDLHAAADLMLGRDLDAVVVLLGATWQPEL